MKQSKNKPNLNMTKMCPDCGTHYLFGNEEVCVSCQRGVKSYDCSIDGHVGKKGLITMFVCIHCGFNDELAPELIPSEEQLAIMGGWNGQKGEEEY